MQQVLLRGGRGCRAGEGVLQGCEQAPERAALGAIRAGSRGQSRHGNRQGLPHAQRRHVHVRAAQARPERVLRQALGVGGRHPHGAHRVPHTQLNTGQPPAYPNTMGRGRSGGITTSWRKAQRNPHRYATMLQFKQAPPAAAPYRAVLPSTPHKQTLVWVRQKGSTPREHPVS